MSEFWSTQLPEGLLWNTRKEMHHALREICIEELITFEGIYGKEKHRS
jgi:hypothetical protein